MNNAELKIRLKKELLPNFHPDRPLQNRTYNENLQLIAEMDNRRSLGLKASEELYYRVIDFALPIAVRLCKYDAADVLHDTYVELIACSERWESEPGYLFIDYLTTTLNRVMQRCNRAYKKVCDMRESYEGELNDVNDDRITMEELRLREKMYEALHEEIRTLSDEQRLCLQLKIFEGQTYKSICQQTNLRIGAIRERLDTALETLTERLKSRGFSATTGSALMMLTYSATVCHGSEQRLKMFEAIPAVLEGSPMPAECLRPAVYELYAAGHAATPVAAPWTWKLGLLVMATSIPVAATAWTLLPSRTANQTSGQPSQVQTVPQNSAAPVPETKPEDIPLFPRNPKAGQVHQVHFPSPNLTLPFVWVPPGKDGTAGFWMGQTELTQLQWKAVGIQVTGVDDPGNPSEFRGDDLPVESVTPNECLEFTKRLTSLTHTPFRLPTPSEWRCAAMASEQSGKIPVGERAWYSGNTGPTTHPVATRRADEINAYDLYGNVFEVSYQKDVGFMIHGGCWDYDESWCTPESKSSWQPDHRVSGTGFRIVHSPAP